MLDRLVASRPDRRAGRAASSAILSLIVHGGILTAAVVATLPPPRLFVWGEIALIDSLVYHVPSDGTRRAAGGAPVGRTPVLPADFRVGVGVPEISVPDLDRLGPPDSVGSWTGPASGGGTAGGLPYGPGLGGQGEPGAVYHELTVEQPPMILTRPPLVYPLRLREAGIEGWVMLEVVVDSAGVPEPASLRVVEASHPGFVTSAMQVVLAARFRPGRVRGQSVRVLIRQPIVFRIVRRGR